MKKIFTLTLVCAALFLAACGSSGASEDIEPQGEGGSKYGGVVDRLQEESGLEDNELERALDALYDD